MIERDDTLMIVGALAVILGTLIAGVAMGFILAITIGR